MLVPFLFHLHLTLPNNLPAQLWNSSPLLSHPPQRPTVPVSLLGRCAAER